MILYAYYYFGQNSEEMYCAIDEVDDTSEFIRETTK